MPACSNKIVSQSTFRHKDPFQSHQATTTQPATNTTAKTQAEAGSSLGVLLPEDINAEDLAVLIRETEGNPKAFTKLRKRLHGDHSLTYKALDRSESALVLSQQVWETFEDLYKVSQNFEDETSNYERPFLVAVDESASPPRAVQAFILAMGDADSCFHSQKELQQARQNAPPNTRLGFGHTHPVFPPVALSDTGQFGLPKSQRNERTFGAFPSNIFIGLQEWQRGDQHASPAAREKVVDLVITPRLYKKHGADYCSSLLHQHKCCNPPDFGPTSHYEFIFTPQLRQLGVFHNAPGGTCTYTPWVVER